MRPFNATVTTICFCVAVRAGAQSTSRDTTVRQAATVAPDSLPACCTIVGVDSSRAVVTARETATGFTFRFSTKDLRPKRTLRVGQPVWADFATQRVRLAATDITPCCPILATQEKP